MQNQKYLPDSKVAERYGVSIMTLWRWTKDDRLGFPAPIKIAGRNYRSLAELEAFERHADRRQAGRRPVAQV